MENNDNSGGEVHVEPAVGRRGVSGQSVSLPFLDYVADESTFVLVLISVFIGMLLAFIILRCYMYCRKVELKASKKVVTDSRSKGSETDPLMA